MLTHIAYLITLPPIVFTLDFVQKRNLISWLPIFCLFSPSFLLLHPDWLTPISYFIWSLGQPCVFARLCCFHPCLSSKKKASVVVAHFLFILPFFILLHPDLLTSPSNPVFVFLIHEHLIHLYLLVDPVLFLQIFYGLNTSEKSVVQTCGYFWGSPAILFYFILWYSSYVGMFRRLA